MMSLWTGTKEKRESLRVSHLIVLNVICLCMVEHLLHTRHACAHREYAFRVGDL